MKGMANIQSYEKGDRLMDMATIQRRGYAKAPRLNKTIT